MNNFLPVALAKQLYNLVTDHHATSKKISVRKTKAVPQMTITGKTVKLFRDKYSISQALLAQALRVNPTTLQSWERGKPISPASQQLMQVYITQPETFYNIIGYNPNLKISDFRQEVLTNWGNTAYQRATGDMNFERVPKRVWDNWYGETGIGDAERHEANFRFDYMGKHTITRDNYPEFEKALADFTQSYFRKIYDDFNLNGWS